MLAAPKNKYRATNHPRRIKIVRQTTIKEAIPEPKDFPLHAYDIKPFDELARRIGNDTLLSDAIGVATRQTDIIPSANDQDPRRQIFIKNESDRLAIVTLWGKHAEEFDAQSLYEGSIEQNMVTLFTGMTVSNFKGLLAFRSTSLTRCHFNPPIPETEFLHNSFEGQHYMIEWDGHGAAPAAPLATTLHALGKEEIDSIIGKKFILNILITQINDPHNWWFYSCKTCLRGMLPHGNTRKCPGCGITEDRQRYKLSIDAIDIKPSQEDKTITGRFILFGDHAAAIIGKDLSLLLAQARGKHNFIPPAISAVVGKKCTVTAIVKDDTYDAEDENLISFKVSKAELINQLPAGESSSSQLNLTVNKEALTLKDQPQHTKEQHESYTDQESTPARDVIDSTDNSGEGEEGLPSPYDSKKRKDIVSEVKSTKKRSTTGKETHTGKKLNFDSNR